MTLFKRFRSLDRAEAGSAMTEFIIGLPIFVMIFIGMGALYRLNNEALKVKAMANAALWKDAEPQARGMVPIVGALTSVSSFGDLFQNGLSGAGMYVDSWAKANIPERLIPGQTIAKAASPPKKLIKEITKSDGTFANDLLNDMINPQMNADGWANVVTSLVNTTGAGPAIAAGQRYGAVEGEASVSFSHPFAGNVSMDPGKLDMPMPNASVHRVAAVALTRLEMYTEQPYKNSTLKFEIGPDTSGNAAAQAGSACGTQGQQYGNCINDNKAAGMAEDDAADACSDLEPDSNCGSMAGTGAPSFNSSWCKSGCAGK